MPIRANAEPPKGRVPGHGDPESWLCLAAAGILLPFTNFANSIALAAWLAPVFLLRYLRRKPSKTRLAVACAVLAATAALMSLPLIAPFPKTIVNAAVFGFVLLVSGLVLVLPYAIDQYVAPRLEPLAASLVFPTALVAKEYALSLGPLGSWGASAYSQHGALALLQVLSVTGLWGLPFLMGWFAAACNLIWENGLRTQRVRSVGLLCAGSIAVVVVAGSVRMAVFPPSSPTVRIAGLSSRPIQQEPGTAGTVPEFNAAASLRMRKGEATPDDISAFRHWSAATGDDLLERAEKEMVAGARMVFWGEANVQLLKGEEVAFIGRARELARKRHAYLGMGLAVWELGSKHPIDNKVILVQPDGSSPWEYRKNFPAPILEAPFVAPGDGRLREVETQLGLLSVMICADADYPRLAAQAGTAGVGLMFVPSNDWQGIDPWHTQMASFRAIEQGFNLARPASHGLSAAFDYQGRRLAAMDYFQTASYAMVAEVPTKGVRTVYSMLGDWFAWASLAGLIVLAVKGTTSPTT